MVLDIENKKTNGDMVAVFHKQEYGTQGSTPTIYSIDLGEGQTGQGLLSPSIETYIQFMLFQLTDELKALNEDVKSLREELSNRPLVSSSLLNNLDNEKFNVKVPISIIIEETDEECLARWLEINAFGIGSTASEAIHNLKGNISDLYIDISSRDKATLGEIALDNLKTLEIHIGVNK